MKCSTNVIAWGIALGTLACGGSTPPQTASPPDGGGAGDAPPVVDGSQPVVEAAAPTNEGGRLLDAGASQLAASPFFGFSESSSGASAWPTVPFGLQRFWDTPYQWPSLNTASGVFTFDALDADLALAYTKGTRDAMYTLARTPPWATSQPTDSNCHYATAMNGGGNGECDAPSDLNADGSGTNATWKAWITAIATHANDATYLTSHAHIRYWEVWNEPDSQPFWAGSIAQLARLVEDANCIITGRGVVHENGDGTATPCTASPIDPTAVMVMPSGNTGAAPFAYAQNELYCNASPTGYELPCPNPPNAISVAIDVVNFHMKPGNDTSLTPEAVMEGYLSNIHQLLQGADKQKPLWNGEAQVAELGFTGAYTDPDLAASFIPRFYLQSWSLGIVGMAWYWNTQNAPTSVTASFQQTYDWLEGSSLVQPCAANGTVWSCTLSNRRKDYLVLWDVAQTCASGSCTTAPQSVANNWLSYQDMTTASTPAGIVDHSVEVGIKPVLLSP